MPDNNSMGLGYAIALLDELKLGGCRAVALETLKSAVLAQQTTNSAMDAIAEQYINEVAFLDSSNAGVVRSFVEYVRQQHQ